MKIRSLLGWMAASMLAGGALAPDARAQSAPAHAGEAPQAADSSAQRRGYASTVLRGDQLELRFKRWGDAILVDNVMVNGKGPFRFLLDTGAEGAGRVDAKFAEALSLPKLGEATTLHVLGDVIPMTEYRIDTLALGGLRFDNVRVLGRAYKEFSPPNRRSVDGILGYHLFREYLLTIDYPARTITVARGELGPADGATILPIVSDDEDPEVEVTLGDRKVKALLDTGGMLTVGVPSTLAKELTFDAEPVVRGNSGGREVRAGTLRDSLRVGGAEFPRPTVMIADGVTQPVIGIRTLSQLSLTFDQQNARVRVVQPPPRKGYGLSIRSNDKGAREVREVVAGGVADRAGLRTTDRIVAINGRPAEGLDAEDLSNALDHSPMTIEVDREGTRVSLTLALE